MFAVNARINRCLEIVALPAALVLVLGGVFTHAGTPDRADTTLSGGDPPVVARGQIVPAADQNVAAQTAQTFGEAMHPESTTVLSPTVATVKFSNRAPDWIARDVFVRWDTPGAFAHSLDPVPYLSLLSDRDGKDYRRPAVGGEYHLNNSVLKNADVRFTVTGKKFAIRYWTVKSSDAMVWIDGKPVAATTFAGTDPTGGGSWNWLVVSRASGDPANVRLAGPTVFSGIDFDSAEPVTVSAEKRFTLGVISDSMFEAVNTVSPTTQSAGLMLSTLTGFRVWNMAEGGTGYINDGSGTAAKGGVGYPGHLTSPFGSSRRLASVESAPIDALLVNGSINDLAWGASAQRSAMDTFLDRVAAARPDLPVVLVSLEPLSYSTVRDQTDVRFQTMNANFDTVASRHPNVVGVIDPYTEDWLTGTGSTASPTGDGNQDRYVGSDGAHLNAAGQAYYQGRIVKQLRLMPAHLGAASDPCTGTAALSGLPRSESEVQTSWLAPATTYELVAQLTSEFAL